MSVDVLSVRGLRPEFGKVDRDLWLWFCEAKKDSENYHGPRVTKRLVQAKAKQAFQAAGILNFKASDGWYIRWLKRWHRVGLNSPKRLKDENNSSKKDFGIAQIARQQPQKKSRSKTATGPNLRHQYQTSINSENHDGGLSIQNQTNLLGSYNHNGPVVLSCSESNIPSQPLVVETGNVVLPSSAPFELPASNNVVDVEPFCSNGSTSSLSSGPYLSKHCHLQSEGQESEGIENQPPSSSSLLNLDDFVWNDISEISYFDELVSSKISQDLEVQNADRGCTTKFLPPAVKCVQKSPIKGREKLPNSPKSLAIYGASSSINPSPDTTSSNFDIGLSARGSSYLLHYNQLPLNVSNHPTPKLRDKFSHNFMDFDETTCANFAQHDFEDVSLSSDFVNQLDDEQFLELNLECSEENFDERTAQKTTLSSKLCRDSNALQPVKNDCVSMTPIPPSGKSLINNNGSGSEMGCAMIVTEDDLSSEENDYISEAVMLSMQEDDFSILNCDQSPFQGTISVADENSQPECDTICDFEDEVLISKENTCINPEIVLPQSKLKHYDFFSQKWVDFKEVPAVKSVGKSITSSQNLNILEKSSINQEQLLGKIVVAPAQYFVASPAANDESVIADTSLLVANLKDSSSKDGVNHPAPRTKVGSMSCQLPSLNESFSTHKVFESSSLMDSEAMARVGNVFEVSPCVDEIPFAEGRDLIQISSPGDAGTLVTEPDAFFPTCSSEGDLSSLSSTYFSGEKLSDNSPSFLLSGSCSPTDSIGAVSNLFCVPFPTQEESESYTAAHFDVSSVISNNESLSGTACAIGGQSQKFLVSSNCGGNSTDLNSSDTTQLLADDRAAKPIFSSLINCNLKSSPMFSSTFKGQAIGEKSHVIISNNQSGSTGNFSKHTSATDTGPSTILMNHKSFKENGRPSCTLEFSSVSSSKQSESPGNLLREPKKSGINFTEKVKSNSVVVDGKQALYRRSSGDRYFPYFKERVANYAIKHTAKEAAKFFGVNVDTVTMWTRGRHEHDSAVRNQPDHLMLRWLKRNRENGVILSREQIVEKAVQLLKTPGNWVKDKSRWFHVWASRLADEEKKRKKCINGPETSSLPIDCGEKKALYPDDFKVEVVLYAEQTSKNLASTTFNIARKRVFEWTAAFKVSKDKDQSFATSESEKISVNLMSSDRHLDKGKNLPSLESIPSYGSSGPMKLKLNGKGMGRAVTSVAVDHELWLWFCEQTAKKSKPKSKDIRAKAVELFRAHNHEKIQCSHGWLKKWSMRYGIALRHEGDGDLLAWCLEQFDRNRNISHRDLLARAQESLTGTHKSEFKASAGWLVRFCKRHKNLLSMKPSIDVEIPAALRPSVSEFRSCIQNVINSSKVPLTNIGCMDELPFNFTAGGSRSRLLLRRSGLENCHATIIMSCLASGELLPPAIIFKGEGPMEHVIYEGVPLLLFYQADCCMTTPIMIQWLELVWNKNVTGPTVLIADCYDPHCAELVKKKCNDSNISLHTIPAGCSYKLQPLDLAISRLFESNIYNRWTKHFTSSDQLSTCKKTSYSSNSDIARWVAEAHNNLKQTQKEAMRRSFLITGLISSLNGTEDQMIEDISHLSFSSHLPA